MVNFAGGHCFFSVFYAIIEKENGVNGEGKYNALLFSVPFKVLFACFAKGIKLPFAVNDYDRSHLSI